MNELSKRAIRHRLQQYHREQNRKFAMLLFIMSALLTFLIVSLF